MEFKFVPSVCKDQPEKAAKYDGHLTLKSMTFDEACDYSEKVALALVDVPEAIRDIRRGRENVRLIETNVLAVDLRRRRDGVEFKSWQALKDGAVIDVLTEAVTAVMSGSSEGNG